MAYNFEGNWNKEYLNPNTSANRAQELYKTYGSRYNWVPLASRLDPNFNTTLTPTPTTKPSTIASTTTIPTQPKPAQTSYNFEGNWNKEYLNPNTSAQRAQELYNTYGSRYNWVPLASRLDPNFNTTLPKPTPVATPIATPVAATKPAVKTPTTAQASYNLANNKEVMPFVTMGSSTYQNLAIPKYQDNTSANQQMVSDVGKVGNTLSYLPSIQNDAIYKNQMEEGQRALGAKLAAQGLTNSGAELEANRRMISDLTSQQASRNLEIAKADQATQAALAGQRLGAMADLYKNDVNRYAQDIAGTNLAANMQADQWKLREMEADRLANMQQNESSRLTNEGNTNWARMMDLLGFMQGANPLGYSQNATDSLAKIYESMGSQIPQMMLGMK